MRYPAKIAHSGMIFSFSLGSYPFDELFSFFVGEKNVIDSCIFITRIRIAAKGAESLHIQYLSNRLIGKSVSVA